MAKTSNNPSTTKQPAVGVPAYPAPNQSQIKKVQPVNVPANTGQAAAANNATAASSSRRKDAFLYQILLLKGVAAVYLIAFTMSFFEATSLIGSDGLLPANVYLKWMHSSNRSINDLPTIYWFTSEINQFIVKLFPDLSQYDELDTCLMLGSLIGIVLSVSALVWNRMMNSLSFFVMWFLHLSIIHIGQTFFKFHWDLLLLEVGFLCLFFTPNRANGAPLFDEISVVVKDLLKCIHMWLTCIHTKSNSQCQKWMSLNSLQHLSLVQPSPTPLSWYMYHLPLNIQKLLVATNFIVLIGGSVILMLPYRRFRIFAMILLIIQQVIVMLTHNLGFLNVLTILTTLAAADDEFLHFCIPRFVWKIIGAGEHVVKKAEVKVNKTKEEEEEAKLNRIINTLVFLIEFLIFVCIALLCFDRYFGLDSQSNSAKTKFTIIDVRVHLINGHLPNAALVLGLLGCLNNLFSHALKYAYLKRSEIVKELKRIFAAIFAFIMFMLSAYMFFAGINREINVFPINIPSLAIVAQNAQAYYISNSYGLFPRIQHERGREEFVFEVSADGVNYKEMNTFSKVGSLDKPLSFLAPYQSRLDWQLWLSGSRDDVSEPYLSNLVYKLVYNKPNALSLFEENPLGQGVEIKSLNIVKYFYSYSSEQKRKETGQEFQRHKRTMILENQSSVYPPDALIQRYKLEANTVRYPLHPLRTIPILPIIWTLLILAGVKNLWK